MTQGSSDSHTVKRKSVLRRLAGEPLFQFLLVGAALFGLNHYVRGSDAALDETRIELTRSDVRQLSLAWLAQGRPAPTPAQLQGLVDQKVAMEILVREAKTIGLDQDDEVIKRRLAQKMDFLFEDVARAREPTEVELRAWFAQNAARFAEPPRIAFRHYYYALDRGHSEQQVEAVKSRIARLDEVQVTADLADADPFMFEDAYTDATPEQIAKIFGPDFAKRLFDLPTGDWQGPIRSGYGLHLVHIYALTPSSVPKFEDVEPQVKNAWIDDQTRELKQKAFEELKAHYTVVLPPLDDPSLVVPGTAEATTQ